MKKLIAILLIFALTFGAAACKGDGHKDVNTTLSGKETNEKKGAEVVILISAAGVLDDRAFNTACWSGIQDFCKETNKTYAYYQPTEDTVEAQMVICDTAVKAGAKIIIINSDQFKLSAVKMQETYPEVTFIIYDTVPTREDGTEVVNSNVTAITFAEEQCGYIAGYAAVIDGYTKLGFLGGMPVPAVVRFGYGFVAGVNRAAKDLGVKGVELIYGYLGNFQATPDNQALAASWYQNGTQLIFAAAGPAGASVFKAAEDNDGVVIGVDADQSQESETVISSAMKDLRTVTHRYLAAWNSGTLEGGRKVRLTAAENGVSLPMETSRWAKFSQADYDSLYARLAADENGMASSIPNDESFASPKDIPADSIVLTCLE